MAVRRDAHGEVGEISVPADVSWSDVGLASLLAAATVIYLVTLPLNVYAPPDEGHALHQAKRLLDGEVLYRDLFDLVTPAWAYLMAGLFRLFGCTLATARTAVAVIHGATVVGVFFLCRRLGVRRALACVAAATQLIVCQPAYPVANRHWLVTLLCVVLLLWMLPVRGRGWRSLGTGLITGMLIVTHQQRGMMMGLGVCAVMVGDSLLVWRYGGGPAAARLMMQLMVFACAMLLVVVPVLALVVMRAGIGPVWYALITHPLTHYRGTLNSPWGQANALSAPTTFPVLVKFLPLVLILCLSRFLFLAWHARDAPRARALLLLTLLCAFAILSILYYPDFIHVAFIAPLFFVALAESLEWALRALPRRLATAVASIVAVAILGGGGIRLARNWTALHSQFGVTRMTAFGRIDFTPLHAALYDKLDLLLRDVPSRTLYVHPVSSHLYLILGAHNPTRFEFMWAGSYNSLEQAQEVVDALEANDVPYVVALPAFMNSPSDPIVRYIRQQYAPLSDPSPTSRFIWQRKRDHQ